MGPSLDLVHSHRDLDGSIDVDTTKPLLPRREIAGAGKHIIGTRVTSSLKWRRRQIATTHRRFEARSFEFVVSQLNAMFDTQMAV